MNPSTLILAETEGPAAAWWGPLVWTALAFLIILVLGRIGVAHAREKLPRNPLTLLSEHVYIWIEDMCVNVIGPHGRKYVPFIITIYLLVLTSNFLGIIGLVAPTANLGITFGLAVLVVLYVQEEGIRANGPIGYIKHFFGPPLGPAYLLISLLLFFIEVVSEAAKMLSLSLRLQGNMSGEHKVGETLGSLIHITPSFAVPLQTLLMPLSVFVALVQALVFTMLSCVYLGLMTHHEEGAHAEAH